MVRDQGICSPTTSRGPHIPHSWSNVWPLACSPMLLSLNIWYWLHYTKKFNWRLAVRTWYQNSNFEINVTKFSVSVNRCIGWGGHGSGSKRHQTKQEIWLFLIWLFHLQQLNAVIAASMSVKASTRLRQILEVRFLKNQDWHPESFRFKLGGTAFLAPRVWVEVQNIKSVSSPGFDHWNTSPTLQKTEPMGHFILDQKGLMFRAWNNKNTCPHKNWHDMFLHESLVCNLPQIRSRTLKRDLWTLSKKTQLGDAILLFLFMVRVNEWTKSNAEKIADLFTLSQMPPLCWPGAFAFFDSLIDFLHCSALVRSLENAVL